MRNRKKQYLVIALLLMLLLAASAGLRAIYNVSSLRSSDAGKAVEENDAGVNTGGDAVDEPLVTLFLASDYQAQAGWDAPKDNLTALMEAAKADGKEADMIVLCGDYTNDPVLHDYQLSPEESILEIREAANSEFDGLDDEDMLFVQGNHDKLTGSIAESGLHEYSDHLVYVLNTENDFPWKQGRESGCLAKVRESSKAMRECLDELIRRGETRPVFIAGHVPIHFTARTSTRHTTGDNLYSSLIFDAVNEAAKSLDIVYLYGHNHSKGWDCYMGGSSVYRSAGDALLIPEFDENRASTDEYSCESLNFTYLNAGYTGYYMNCGPEELALGMADDYSAADETLTCTVCEVFADKLVLTRYDRDGVHCLSHEGAADPYKGGIDEGLISDRYYGSDVPGPQEIVRRTQ